MKDSLGSKLQIVRIEFFQEVGISLKTAVAYFQFLFTCCWCAYNIGVSFQKPYTRKNVQRPGHSSFACSHRV